MGQVTGNEETQVTELTLGTGTLLAIFFAVAIMCGIFFSLGYSIGKNSTPLSTQIGDTPAVALAKSSQGGAKPTASSSAPVPASDCPAGQSCPGASSTDETTLLNQPAKSSSPSAVPETPSSTDNPVNKTSQSETPATSPKTPAPPESAASAESGFMVQVAAVTRQEDADALVSALRRKSYPVFVTNSSSDKLFHVQVGPFAEAKDAESMRSKLAGDGYNAIVKK